MGMFYRTVRMVDNGIKPVYVFDGKPPTLKSGEVSIDYVAVSQIPSTDLSIFQLAKRKARKEEAQSNLEEANETGEI